MAVEPARSVLKLEGVFVLGVQGEGEPAKGRSRHLRGHQGREGTSGRAHAVHLAHDERRAATLQLDDRKRAMLLEGWGGLSRLVGKGHPKLNASEMSAILGRRLLRVTDPQPGG